MPQLLVPGATFFQKGLAPLGVQLEASLEQLGGSAVELDLHGGWRVYPRRETNVFPRNARAAPARARCASWRFTWSLTGTPQRPSGANANGDANRRTSLT